MTRSFAGIVERVGDFHMPFWSDGNATLRKCALKSVDAGAGPVIVALKRRDDADVAVSEFDKMQGRAMGGAFVVGADARIRAVRPVYADIDEGNRAVGEQFAQARRDGSRPAEPARRPRG